MRSLLIDVNMILARDKVRTVLVAPTGMRRLLIHVRAYCVACTFVIDNPRFFATPRA